MKKGRENANDFEKNLKHTVDKLRHRCNVKQTEKDELAHKKDNFERS
jgi:hypothetical protein